MHRIVYAYISSKKTPLNPTRPRAQTSSKSKSSPPPSALRSAFSGPQLLRQFHKLLPVGLIIGWLDLSPQTFYERAFTPLITLWYMVFQRLHDNHHLSNVQNDAREGGADRLSPRRKRLSVQITSESTSAFSDARQRLPLSLLRKTLWHIADQIERAFRRPLRLGFKVGLLDGTTFRLRPFGDIPKEFVAHRSSHSKHPPYWCLARVVGIVCLATGAVLDTVVGSPKHSEQALSAAMLQARCWNDWLLLADRNFGVYSMIRSIRSAQGHALVRLTKVRAGRLARCAGCRLQPALDVVMAWSPSRHDQCPEGITRDPVPGRLLVARVQIPGRRALTLYFFTTLVDPVQYPAQDLVQLYVQRWNVEVCFRYIKVQMDMGLLPPHSAEMGRKEWLAGMIAYNLIRWTMAAAAALAQVPVRWLSFCRARGLLLRWLEPGPLNHRSARSWMRLLTRIANARQPKRRKRRPSEPRAIRPSRTHFPTLYGSRAAARRIHRLNS
jgi:hypothetical protein